jgi:hypothetical protein
MPVIPAPKIAQTTLARLSSLRAEKLGTCVLPAAAAKRVGRGGGEGGGAGSLAWARHV